MLKKLNTDIWRFLVAFLIVAIHISPFENISPQFDFFFTRILGRIAVPLYLMITGYYILDKALDNKKILVAYIKKILKIYLFCIILYIPINIYMGKFQNINFISMLKDILINGTLYHLWYFPALILGLIITYYLIKKLGKKKTFIIVIFLYIIGLLGDSYYGITKLNPVLNNCYNFLFSIFDYTRNGLFFAPIFLYLGYYIKTNKKKNYKLWCILLLFIGMTIEGMVLHHYNIQRHDSMYIFLVPLMYFVFGYIVSNSKTTNKKLRSTATSIYIFHPMVIIGVRFIAGVIGMEKILVENHLILYISVCILTVIFTVIIEKMKGVILNGKK